MESVVHETKTLCVKGIAGYSIQAGDIVITLWGFQLQVG